MIIKGTEILTKDGFRPVEADVEDWGNWGTSVYSEGALKEAYVEWDGKHPVWTYSVAPYYNTNQVAPRTFQAPRPCCFDLVSGYTYDLRAKDVLKANGYDCGYDAPMWAHGFMKRFAILSLDGLDPTKYGDHCQKLTAIKSLGEIKATDGSLPYGKTPTEIGSFIRGYLAADGQRGTFSTPDAELFRFFVDHHGYAGLVLTGSERKTRKVLKVNRIAEFYDAYEITYAKGHDFQGFRVIDVSGPSAPQDVYKVYLEGSYVTKGGWTLVGD